MGGQAVHEQGLGVRFLHHRGVHLVGGEGAAAFLLLVLLSHAGPDVGHHQVGAIGRLARIAHDGDPVRRCRDHTAVRLVTRWAGDAQLEIILTGGMDVGLAHIVAVTDPGHGTAADVATQLMEGLHVREQLAGVMHVGQGVDHRGRRAGAETLHGIMVEGADHDDVHHARHHPRTVLHRFATSQLGVAWRQEHGVAAELCHAGLEGDPGAGGGFLEDHCQHFAAQRLVRLAPVLQGLEFDAAQDQLPEFLGIHVQQGQEVAYIHGVSLSGVRRVLAACAGQSS